MYHEYKENENIDTFRYDSWNEFVEHADKRVSQYGMPASREYGKEWYGTDTFPEAITLATEGWPEGLSNIRAISARLINRVTSLVEQATIEYSVTGNDFDIPMMLAGEPEHWYTQVQHIEQGRGFKVIRVLYNSGASGSVSSDVLTRKGAAVAALVECLEYAGFRVELTIAKGTQKERGYGYKFNGYVPLKAADQPLEMDRLAFALCNAATLRRLWFGVEESLTHFHEIMGMSYGHSIMPEERGDINISESYATEPQWESEEAAEAWIIANLREQGVAIEGLQAVPA